MSFHVITDFTRMEGAQVMLARLLRHEVDPNPVVVSLRGVSDDARNRAGNPEVRYYSLGMTGIIGLPKGMWTLVRIMRRERPAAILCWMYHAAVVGLLAAYLSGSRQRVYWTIRQALDDPQTFGKGLRVMIQATSFLSRFCDGIIYNSHRAMTQHGRAGFKNYDAVVIPNGIDIPARPNHTPRVPRVLGIAARHNVQKDHPTFLKASARLLDHVPDAKFVAVGHGMTPDNPDLAKQIRDAGLPSESIDLRGPQTDMKGFYGEIDVLVLSSRTEGFPNVVGEAMSYGIPVVTTDVGDAASIVADAGAVVPAGDDRALSSAMQKMCELESDAYSDLSHRAARRVRENYDLAGIVERYRSIMTSGRLVTPVWQQC